MSDMPQRMEGRAIRRPQAAWFVGLGAAAAGVALVSVALAASGRNEASAPSGAGARRTRAEDLVVAATPLGERDALVCLVDVGRERLAVYLADGRRSRLRLLAVRDISADWALTDFNNDPPLPNEIRARVQKALGGGEPAPEPGAGQ